jgi:alanyl-tRNA synthetase
VRSVFTGYEAAADQGEIVALLRTASSGALAGGTLDALAEGDTAAVVLSRTPFYPEKGGQVGDRGVLRGAAGVFEVSDTQQPAEGLIVHVGRLVQGRLLGGETVKAEVDAVRRASTARHHTATHLLQWALRQVVSPSIKQAGSLVSPDRLRFDFNYFEALSPEVLAQVERLVNEQVLACHPLRTYEMALKDVPGSGIIAIFDEKYGDQVRVADIAGYSRELCGGTHVENTGEIGLFRILSEGSIASGVRRLEAVCGLAAYEETGRERELVGQLTKRFSVAAADVPGRVDALVARIKELEGELRKRDAAAALAQAASLAGSARDVAGVKLLAAVVGEQSADALKDMADALMARLGSGVVVLGGTTDGKAQFIAAVSQDCVAKGLHAGKLLKEVAKVAGGGGGGQPGLARAGGRDAAKIEEAIRQAPAILQGMAKAQ